MTFGCYLALEAQSNYELASLKQKAAQLEGERKEILRRHAEESEKFQQQLKALFESAIMILLYVKSGVFLVEVPTRCVADGVCERSARVPRGASSSAPGEA